MEEDFEWFLEHYNEIYQLCDECYVVINEKKIIAIFLDSYAEAYQWVKERGLLGKCNIQYCSGDEDGYTAYVY